MGLNDPIPMGTGAIILIDMFMKGFKAGIPPDPIFGFNPKSPAVWVDMAGAGPLEELGWGTCFLASVAGGGGVRAFSNEEPAGRFLEPLSFVVTEVDVVLSGIPHAVAFIFGAIFAVGSRRACLSSVLLFIATLSRAFARCLGDLRASGDRLGCCCSCS